MNGDGRPRQRRQRRGGPACDGDGSGAARGGRSARGGESSLGGRTTTRALIAVGTYVAQDLRDAEGLMRPMLRRAALRLALSRREPARRLGNAYLRLDPPAPEAIPAARRRDRSERRLVSSPGHRRGAGRGSTPAEGEKPTC